MSAEITVTFQGRVQTVSTGTRVRDTFDGKLGRDIIAARVNGTLVDLSRPLYQDATVEPVVVDSVDGLHVLRHSAAARMIGAGASPKAVQMVLGHRSAAFTLTVYGHLFDADLDDLAARLDGDMGTALGILAASPRPGAPDEELSTGSSERKSASDLG